MSDLKKLGPHGEAFAKGMLLKRGDKVLASNYVCPQGELDLVSWHKDTLVFTEVRTRSSLQFGSPAETVTPFKQLKVKRAANWFVVKMYQGRALPPCRFDVIWLIAKDGAIVESGIIEGAFC